MKSLLQYLILESKSISQAEWATYKIKNQGAITNELKAMLNISTAKELKLGKDSKAKCMTPEGQQEIKEELGLSASGDLIQVFTQAFQQENVLSNFAEDKVSEITIMEKPGLEVVLKPSWSSIAKKTASSARCIKFWMQSIAISCGVTAVDASNFEVGINQSDNRLLVFLR